MSSSQKQPTISCQDCQFYRDPTLVPQALERALTRPNQQSNVMLEIDKAHTDQRAAEFEHWVELSFSEVEDARWEPRPAASAYCGVHETKSPPRYFLAEVRNAAGDCGGQPRTEVRSCMDCTHSVQATGDAEDEREIGVTIRLGLLGDTGAHHELTQRIATNQGREVRAAHQNDGYLAGPPRYLEYCTHSTPHAPGATVCAVKNPDGRCPYWESRPIPSQPTHQSGEAPPMNDESLQREIAHSSLAVLRRMAHEVRSLPFLPPAPEDLAAWSDLLDERMAGLPQGLLAWLRATPALEETWEWRWQGLTPAERSLVAGAWREQLRALAAAEPELGRLAEAVDSSGPPRLPSQSKEQGAVAGAIADLNRQDRETVATAEDIDPRLAQKVRMQADVKNAEWVERMAGLMHQTQMSIIANIHKA